jgi:predicted transcriptional regulator
MSTPEFNIVNALRRNSIRLPQRDQYKFVKQILQTVYTKTYGCRSYELVYRCELSWPQFTHSRDLLFGQKLLISFNLGPNQRYEITDRGLRLLQLFTEIVDDLRPILEKIAKQL